MNNQIQEMKDSKGYTARQYLQTPAFQKKLEEMIGSKKNQFVASLISALSTNRKLTECEPNSVIYSALTAASLDLPINSSLGFAHIVPYWDNKTKMKYGQFQMGYKGYIQLAIRTGQYKVINTLVVKEGEFVSFDKVTEELKVNWNEDEEEREKLDTHGYVAFFELMNGFRKTIYWTKNKVESHARKYSDAYKYDLRENKTTSQWSTEFDNQGLKTVIKHLISRWGIMSVEIQKAIETDQAVINEDNQINYIDNQEDLNEFLNNDEIMNAYTKAEDKETLDKALEELKYNSVKEVKKEDYKKLLDKIEVISKQKE